MSNIMDYGCVASLSNFRNHNHSHSVKRKPCMYLYVECVDTTSKLALYQDCNTLVTRIEIRIMRLRKDKGVGVGIKGVLQATQDPNVPKRIPVLYD
jgi:hypothetical protein